MHGTIDSAQDIDQEAARERAYSIPLEQFDPGDPDLFRSDTFWPYFDRLRKEDPVHYCKDSMFGPCWSVTKYNDIMDIETHHSVFSSATSRPTCAAKASSPWISRAMARSARPSRRCSRRRISINWRSTSASGRLNA